MTYNSAPRRQSLKQQYSSAEGLDTFRERRHRGRSRRVPCCRMLKTIARGACSEGRLKAFRCRVDFWGYWCRTRKRCAEHWRNGVVRTGENRLSSVNRVTDNPNPTTAAVVVRLQRARTINNLAHRCVCVTPDSSVGNPPLRTQTTTYPINGAISACI